MAACFSVERTKYLMLSKSMPDEVGAPGGHRLAVEELEALQAQVEHPLRLALLRGDVADDVLVEAALGASAPASSRVGPAELVAADALSSGLSSSMVVIERPLLSVARRVASGRVLVAVRDAGGADTVAVGDGGQALDVAAEDLADGLGLGLAQLRELVGDVGDRAVLLAQLLARPGRVAHRRRRSPRR